MDRYKIERALGIIEGISCILTERAIADSLIDAVEMIDMVLEEEVEG